MRDQLLPPPGLWPVLARAKHNVRPKTVRVRVDLLRRACRRLIGMHAHAAEIVAEARLHESARRRIERLAGCAQHFMHRRRCAVGRPRSSSPRDPVSRSAQLPFQFEVRVVVRSCYFEKYAFAMAITCGLSMSLRSSPYSMKLCTTSSLPTGASLRPGTSAAWPVSCSNVTPSWLSSSELITTNGGQSVLEKV